MIDHSGSAPNQIVGANEIKFHPAAPEELNIQEQTMAFETKDSGERQEFSTGMVRDTSSNKARYDLLDVPMLNRWAELMARGAQKYGANNWRKAETQIELDRFKESAFRHFMQWFQGQTDEDHAAAVYFNIAGAEMVLARFAAIANQETYDEFEAGGVTFSNIREIRRPQDIRQG